MISVVMPAHNEEDFLEAAVKTVASALAARRVDHEIIVVQNGSVDRTSTEAARLAAAFEAVRAIDLPVADYGAALREGFSQARGDIVVNFDVDLVDVDFLDRALDVMADGAVAVVVGTKTGPGAVDSRSVLRRVVTGTYSAVLRRGFGLRASDTHGLKALRRRPLTELVARCCFGGDIFDTELILRAERQGLRVEEIPVAVADIRPPRTSISRRIPRTLLSLGRLWLTLRSERPGPAGS